MLRWTSVFIIIFFNIFHISYSNPIEIINGSYIAQEIIDELKNEVACYKDKKPVIAFIRVGEDPASIIYLKKKQIIAKEIGIKSILKVFPVTILKEELLDEIDALNNNPNIHGILVQTPLPKHISKDEAFNKVLPEKDIDGLNAVNLGKLCQGNETGFIPCTAAGICEIFKRTNIQTKGKNIVIVGRSILVGKPMGLLMLKKSEIGNATVTICHSHTKNLKSILRQADIVIVSIGHSEFITADMLSEHTVVIDVGCNRVLDLMNPNGYKLTGDVDFDSVKFLASKITPVPGGVGPMTIAMLMKNTVKAFKDSIH